MSRSRDQKSQVIKGSIRLDEDIIPIIDIYVEACEIVLVAKTCTPATYGGPIRIFGRDGLPVTDQAAGKTKIVPATQVLPGDSLILTYSLSVTSLNLNLNESSRGD